MIFKLASLTGLAVLFALSVTAEVAAGASGDEDKKHGVRGLAKPTKEDKVVICHIPPGNPSNAVTITISENAVEAHKAKGSYVGPCTTKSPSKSPSKGPSKGPSESPSESPSETPSESPSKNPSESPTQGGGDPECNAATCATFIPCEGNTCAIPVCVTTSDDGSNPSGGLCLEGSTSCGGLQDCSNGICQLGAICAIETCCGNPVCIPPDAFCSQSPARTMEDYEPKQDTAGPTIAHL